MLGSADAFARRTSAYRRLRHKHGRSYAIAPDCRQNAEKRGAVAFRRVEAVAFALVPQDVCRIEPGLTHALNGNGNTAIMHSSWRPLLNECVADGYGRENDGLVVAPSNQLCRQQCREVASRVAGAKERVFGLVALAVIEAEIDNAGTRL